MDMCQSKAPEALPEQLLAQPETLQPALPAGRLIHFVVMMAGIGLALVVAITGGPIALWGKISGPSSTQNNSGLASAAFSDRDLDLERPQRQAEILLERAVSRSDETKDQTEAQIEARVEAWRGKLKWDSQLGDLTTVALNSRDQRLRSSAVEVQLAAYGLPKSESSVDALIRQASSRDHAKKIWALWMLGLLGNRGVETDRVVQVLTAQLKDSGKDSETDGNKDRDNKDRDEDARRWAVQGLALVGTTPTIAPLLDAMHNDPSAAVRERAASSLAESAMLSQNQRLIAVPQLINYSGDPALDAQTHALAFQALAAITKQHLPNDSATWRNWYQTTEVSGQ
jgi:HEAT repeat protein